MITAERVRKPLKVESDVSKLLRSSRTFASRIRHETELVEEAWKAAAEAAARVTKVI